MQQQVITTVLPMLIMGLGWTGQFLAELMVSSEIAYVATTRDGRNNTIAWSLPSNCSESVDISQLPYAKTVLVTFPVLEPNCMIKLIETYEKEHKQTTQWILLSSTRPFDGTPATRHSHMKKGEDNKRHGAEKVVIERGGSVLHLAGLWGKQRQPKGWVPRFPTEEAIKNKLLHRQLHLIHGKDVARSILAVSEQFKPGQRWIVTDNGCYDWINLFLTWGNEDQIRTARDLAVNDAECKAALGDESLEEVVARGGVKPRLDSTEFWETFGLEPEEFLKIE